MFLLFQALSVFALRASFLGLRVFWHQHEMLKVRKTNHARTLFVMNKFSYNEFQMSFNIACMVVDTHQLGHIASSSTVAYPAYATTGRLA